MFKNLGNNLEDRSFSKSRLCNSVLTYSPTSFMELFDFLTMSSCYTQWPQSTTFFLPGGRLSSKLGLYYPESQKPIFFILPGLFLFTRTALSAIEKSITQIQTLKVLIHLWPMLQFSLRLCLIPRCTACMFRLSFLTTRS